MDDKRQLQLAEREAWQKLVVKVISWKDEFLYKQQTNKITLEEWQKYTDETIKIDISFQKVSSTEKLEKVKEIIKQHGGFAHKV